MAILRRRARWLGMAGAAGIALARLAFAAESPAPVVPGTIAPIAFDRYSPLAESNEILRRTSTPIAAAKVFDYLHANEERLPDQGVKLADERFWIYVPRSEPPPAGYGLFVFVPPWDGGSVPQEWRRVFDKYGLIYVASQHSGNDEPMLWRRMPLALHAVENVRSRYPVDPSRIYISGFSGGSRTAMRLALTYPDVFRGAVLNSGSDPFGVPGIAVPPGDLFRLFQERSRMVVVSGTEDLFIDARDAAMFDAADRLCVFGLDRQPMLHTSHALMRPVMLDRALEWLERPDPRASRHAEALARCRAGVDAKIAEGLGHVRDLLAQGRKTQAGEALSKIDQAYGGLAAPQSVELARQVLAK